MEEIMSDHYDKGEWDKTEKLLIELSVPATPEQMAEIDADLGWVNWKKKNKITAAEYWKITLANPAATDAAKSAAHAGLSIYYSEIPEKRKEALDHADLARKLTPHGAVIRQNMNLNSCGITLANVGERDKAAQILKKAAEANERLEKSDDPKIARTARLQRGKNGYNMAALILIPLNRYNEAIWELKTNVIPRYQGTEAETDLAAAYHRVAEAYEKLGRYGPAIEYENKSLELWQKHPDDPRRAETAQENIKRLTAAKEREEKEWGKKETKKTVFPDYARGNADCGQPQNDYLFFIGV